MPDRPGAVGRAIQRVVMNDVKHTVCAFAHVEFDIIGTLLKCEIGCSKGVLRRKSVGAAMGYDLGH